MKKKTIFDYSRRNGILYFTSYQVDCSVTLQSYKMYEVWLSGIILWHKEEKITGG